MDMKHILLLLLGCVSVGCQSGDTTPDPVPPSFVTVGDLELTRCSDESCDQFTFLIHNVGKGCAFSFPFEGTVTLTKASGVTSTARWHLTPGDYGPRLFKPGETRRAIQYQGTLRNPAGPHSYSVDVSSVPTHCD
jgi:hypothetical protein